MIKDQIIQNLQSAIEKLGIKNEQITLETPNNLEFGDYAASIALKLAKKLGKNPMIIAEEIVKNVPKNELIENINIIKPGFINFKISQKYLIGYLKQIVTQDLKFESHFLGKEKKVMVEFAHYNPLKLVHIGHIRTTAIGESISRIFETVGNHVIRANYQGDVGMHIAKCLWTLRKMIQEKGKSVFTKLTLSEKIKFIGKLYAEGNTAYESDEEAKKQIIDVNRMIYEKNPEIMDLWKETRQWSLNYFDLIYKKLNTRFDRFYFESEMAERALEIVNEAIKKGVLEKSEGAIVFNGEKYNLNTRVFINSQGFPTYEGKELALAEKEFTEFGELDKCIHVVGPEQASFFKVTIKVEELLDPKKYTSKQYHLSYGWVTLKMGKMSSRSGNVIEAEWLLDEAKNKIIEKYNTEKKVAEVLATSAIKYAYLKFSLQTTLSFDFDESISLSGNSGPYLLYTYVRTQSILKKQLNPTSPSATLGTSNETISTEELNILRALHQYSKVVRNAAIKFAPNLIANFLFDLAQKFNLFYQKYPILKAEENMKNFRLTLTQATGKIIKHGLYLLGIETVEKM